MAPKIRSLQQIVPFDNLCQLFSWEEERAKTNDLQMQTQEIEIDFTSKIALLEDQHKTSSS